MDIDLRGKHALVCGASQGIGQAAAVALARLGADVTVLARREDALKQVVASLDRSGANQQHGLIAVDMADTQALADKVAAACNGHPVHILVNNTGGPPGGALNLTDTDAMADAMRQHLLASQALLQAVLPGMRGSGYGRIVNVLSTSVKEPIANLGVSNSARAAVAAWAKTLSSELAIDGITVNNVLPGFTNTQRLASLISNSAEQRGVSEANVANGMRAQVPAGRFGEAHETAAMIAFLCTPAAAYVNGVSIPVDGGRTRALS